MFNVVSRVLAKGIVVLLHDWTIFLNPKLYSIYLRGTICAVKAGVVTLSSRPPTGKLEAQADGLLKGLLGGSGGLNEDN